MRVFHPRLIIAHALIATTWVRALVTHISVPRSGLALSSLLQPSQQVKTFSRPTTGLSAHLGDIESKFDPMNLASAEADENVASSSSCSLRTLAFALSLGAITATTPTVASAASSPEAIPSAFVAYGHYLSLLLITASIMTERLTVKPAMSIDEEKLLGYADIMTGVAGTALLVTGYYRATAFGKGWEFYSHEPIFWLKMTFLGIFGGLSLFPTITIIQRTVKIQQEGSIEPMSEALADRMKRVMNAELTALATIPLTATLMSRGVGYVNDFPTQIVGPVLFGLVTAGAVYKYVSDALSWKEESLPSSQD